MSALLDGFDKALGLIYFLLGIEQGFLVFPAHLILVLFVGFYHVGEGRRYGQLWHIASVECECNGSVIGCIYDEVGVDLLHVSSVSLAKRCARFRIQLAYLVLECLQLGFVEFQSRLDFIPMFLGKFVEIILEYFLHGFAQHSLRQSFYLQQQAFL